MIKTEKRVYREFPICRSCYNKGNENNKTKLIPVFETEAVPRVSLAIAMHV